MSGKGLLIVLSGPAGTGKGTVVKEILKNPELKLSLSVSMTTRSMRPTDIDGVTYQFVSKEEFMKARENGELLEYAEYVGNYYGTPKANVEKLREEGRNVLLEIEVQGAEQITKAVPDALTIFLVPPSMEELERRLRGRGTEPEEIIQQRLAKAETEMKMSSAYKYVVCNDEVDLASDIISVIIKHYMKKAGNL